MHAQERWHEVESSLPETSHPMAQRCVFAYSFLRPAVSRCWSSLVRPRKGTTCGAPSGPGSPVMRCSWPGRGAAEPATKDPLQEDRPCVTTRSSCIFQSGMRFTRGLILIHQLVGLYHNCNFLRKFDLSN